jgi:carbamoyltransferase
VLNTSFNIKGEPIICTPMDAVKCWASTGLDALVLGPFLLEKPARSLAEAEPADQVGLGSSAFSYQTLGLDS